MNEMQIFNYEDKEIRTQKIEDEIWFVGKDIAAILGYIDINKALKTHIDEDDWVIRPLIDRLGRTQDARFINESGLYSLILSSKLESAKKFKKWVTSEVLPSIRKTGAYKAEPKSDKELRLEYSKQLARLAELTTNEKHREVLIVKSANILSKTPFLEIKGVVEENKPMRCYTATEIGKLFGIGHGVVGKLATQYNLKSKDYSENKVVKMKYGDIKISKYFYYENTLPIFRQIIEDYKKSKRI